MEGMGGGGGVEGEKKLYFPLLKSGKRQKAPLGRSASSHFVADCSKGCTKFCVFAKLGQSAGNMKELGT